MGESHLRSLIEEATVDCYGEYEEFWGLYTALEEALPFPFQATVLGDKVQVHRISQQSNELRGILVEVEKNGHTSHFPLPEIDGKGLDEEAAIQSAAYRLWRQYL